MGDEDAGGRNLRELWDAWSPKEGPGRRQPSPCLVRHCRTANTEGREIGCFAQVSIGPQSPDSHGQPSRDLVREAGEPGCRGQVHQECSASPWGGVWESEHWVHAKDAALRREGAFWMHRLGRHPTEHC